MQLLVIHLVSLVGDKHDKLDMMNLSIGALNA